MWKEKNLLMDEKAMGRAIRRIAHEIIERNKGWIIRFSSASIPGAYRWLNGWQRNCRLLKAWLCRSTTGYFRLSRRRQKDVHQHGCQGADALRRRRQDGHFSRRRPLYGTDGSLSLNAIMELGRPRYIELAVLVDRATASCLSAPIT